MGKNDVALSSYFSAPQIFADLFNAWMYGGKQVIAPESLTAEDPVQPRPEYSRPYKHVRDVVKMYQKDGVQLVLLGIENQEADGAEDRPARLLPGGPDPAGDHPDPVFRGRGMGQAGAAPRHAGLSGGRYKNPNAGAGLSDPCHFRQAERRREESGWRIPEWISACCGRS